jgi:hypothetical protein
VDRRLLDGAGLREVRVVEGVGQDPPFAREGEVREQLETGTVFRSYRYSDSPRGLQDAPGLRENLNICRI